MSIDANDDFILISEVGDWTQKPIENGSVYVYNRNYELIETLHSPDHQERSYFGISVVISRDHMVVGEHWDSVDVHERAGRVHIYDTDRKAGAPELHQSGDAQVRHAHKLGILGQGDHRLGSGVLAGNRS